MFLHIVILRNWVVEKHTSLFKRQHFCINLICKSDSLSLLNKFKPCSLCMPFIFLMFRISIYVWGNKYQKNVRLNSLLCYGKSKLLSNQHIVAIDNRNFWQRKKNLRVRILVCSSMVFILSRRGYLELLNNYC